ncbi:DUF3124 domain-containing protein [Aeoliella sp.]|uniref:DUF3124 domain-containing protein n=1 Tax=Aeoliella sp. TaxID=2795800 RepID=UPI003CCBD477
MAKKSERFPSWFLWIWERGFVGSIVILLILMAVVCGLAVYFDQRLSGIEEKVTYQPPRNYEPPDLKALLAENVDPDSIVTQRLVYVPIYSHVYYNQGRPYLLEATLSIRNTDLRNAVYVRSVRYYDTRGELAKTYVDQPIRLGPLETIEFLVKAHDTTGGSGANFLVEWFSTDSINEPIIEAVMVGTNGAQGIAFSRSGQVLNGTVDEGASADE